MRVVKKIIAQNRASGKRSFIKFKNALFLNKKTVENFQTVSSWNSVFLIIPVQDESQNRGDDRNDQGDVVQFLRFFVVILACFRKTDSTHKEGNRRQQESEDDAKDA